MTPTWSVLLPLLSTFLPYHTHWENNTPNSASTLPTRHLFDTMFSSFIEVMCCQISGMKHTNLQNDSYLVSTPTIAINIPTLPYTLGKQPPNLRINYTNLPPL